MAAYPCRRSVKGGKSSSGISRFGGVWFLVGGVEPSEMPEELAVDGRMSVGSMCIVSTLFGGALFRGSTPTGQVHCTTSFEKSGGRQDNKTYISLAMSAAVTLGFVLVALKSPFSTKDRRGETPLENEP